MNNVIYLRESVVNKTITTKFMTLHYNEKVTSNTIFVMY